MIKELENTKEFESINELENIEYIENEPLAKHITFRVGGPAKVMVFPKDKDEIVKAISFAKKAGMKYMIIGNGSNLLFMDDGYDGMIIKIGSNMNKVEVDGDTIYAEAGAMLSSVANKALKESLAGMEFAAGIPGSVGGAIFMNAGAYGGEMKDIVVSVDILNPDGTVSTVEAEKMNFSYRHSALCDGLDGICLGTTIRLKKGNPDEISAKMKELSVARKTKQPLEYPSAGSTFKRPEGYFAGKLIEDTGLRGYRVGGAMISEKHCGFAINYDKATANDILTLISDVQQKVKEKFGVWLEPEVRIIDR